MERTSKQLKYYYEHKQKRLEYQQKYQENNKEKCREYAKEYYKTKRTNKQDLKENDDNNRFRIERASEDNPFIVSFSD
jgi:hypothetical protein